MKVEKTFFKKYNYVTKVIVGELVKLNEEVFLFCNGLSKENIEEKINYFMTKANCIYSKEEVNIMLIRIVEELAEVKKYELIERVIGTKEKLKELMAFIPLKEEYLYYFYLVSLSTNGKFEELITIFEEVKINKNLKLYEEKIKSNVVRAYTRLTKVDKAINILKKNSKLQEEVNTMLIKMVESSVEAKKYELIEGIIGTKEKLKELMTFIPFKEEYLYHFYLASLSGNGKFEELITTFEEVKPRRVLKLYLEKIRFNVGRAYSKIGEYWKGIELLKENRSNISKLFLVYIYTMLEDDRALDICRELQKSGLYLTPRDEAKIYLTYAKYSLKRGNVDETRENIDKLLFFLSGVETGLKNVLFYEVAQIYKVMGTKEEYIYYLKQAAQFSAEGEVQLCHKLKAILELQNLKVLKGLEATKLLPRQGCLLGSDLVVKLIKEVKRGIILER